MTYTCVCQTFKDQFQLLAESNHLAFANIHLNILAVRNGLLYLMDKYQIGFVGSLLLCYVFLSHSILYEKFHIT